MGLNVNVILDKKYIMKTIKVYFTSHHFKNSEEWVKSILRLTPNNSGKWKNIEYTLNPNEADFYLIMDGTNEKLPDMKQKAIYMYEHPYTPGSPVEKGLNQTNCLLNLPLKDFLNFGELWIEYDYDYIMNLKPEDVKKDKNTICVATYQIHNNMYAQRQVFLRELVNRYPNIELDIYGRPVEKYAEDIVLKPYYKGCLGNNTYDATKGEHIVGKNVIENYKYTIEFDVGPCQNYFSERFYDSLAVWCTPIYFGCQNMSRYLPHEGKAYHIFDQHNLEDVNKINEIINQPPDFKAIAEVRDILFNKYQMFAYCYHVVNNINSYLKDAKGTQEQWIKTVATE